MRNWNRVQALGSRPTFFNRLAFPRHKYKTSWLLALLCFCAWTPIWALDPNKAITQYTLEVWNRDSGLPQNSVLGIIQGQRGFLWISTQEGLVRFDGLHFETYDKTKIEGLRSIMISQLVQDRAGRFWLGTDAGLQVVDGEKTVDMNLPEPLNSDFIMDIYRDRDSRIWVGTLENGLYVFERDEMVLHLTPEDGLHSNPVYSFLQTRDRDIWIGCWDGLSLYRNGKVEKVSDGTPLENLAIFSLYEDIEGTLWVGTHSGLYRQNGQGDFEKFEGTEELNQSQISSMVMDRNRNLWVGTEYEGLFRIYKDKIEHFSVADGLPYKTIDTVFIDNLESLWIGTEGGGLCRLRDGTMTTFSVEEGLAHNMVRTTYVDQQGVLWIATYGGGVVKMEENGKFTNFTIKDGLTDNRIRSIYQDRSGRYWFGTQGGGLNYLENGQFGHLGKQDGLPSAKIGSIHQTRDGSIWVSTDHGLVRIKDGRIRTFTVNDGLTTNTVLALYEDRQGTLWIGTRGGGLNYYRNGLFGAYTEEDGLSSNQILPIYEDEQRRLWIGTSNAGLNLLHQGTFYHFNTEDGLFDDKILDLLPDGKGNFYMTTNRGIFRVAVTELLAKATGEIDKVNFRYFGYSDGMKSAECNGGTFPSLARTPDGRLWFPTIRGVVSMHPDRIFTNTVPPPVYIDRLYADGNRIDLDNSVEIPPGANQIEIHYTALAFLVPENARIMTMLSGYSDDWLDVGRRRVAFYNNLSPGKYTFQVKAANSDGVWNEQGASIVVQVDAEYYQQRWFYALMVLLIVALAIELHRHRLMRIERKENELARLVGERTDELASTNQRLISAQEEVVKAARRAGIAEIAASVLSEVENAINKVSHAATNLSALLKERDQVTALQKVVRQCEANLQSLESYFAQPEGRSVQNELVNGLQNFSKNRKELLQDVEVIRREIRQMMEIVKAQQDYAKISTQKERLALNDLIENALLLKGHELRQNHIKVIKNLNQLPKIVTHKPKILKVLVSLIHNAIERLNRIPEGRLRQLAITTQTEGDQLVRIELKDSGCVENPEELQRIFAHGFSAKPDQREYELYNSVNDMTDLNGRIQVFPNGQNETVFLLQLPVEDT